MTKRQKEKERHIIALSPNRRPYGAKLTLLLEKRTSFNISGECTLLVTPEINLRIKPKNRRHVNGNDWDIFVEGFSTASEAEEVGLKVALGFLWTAIQGRYSVRLIYHTPLPCAVYHRTQSTALSSGWATLSMSVGIANVIGPLDSVIASNNKVDPRLLIALEIFAAARLETTERAKLVGLVSAIEPLVVQAKYDDDELTTLLANFKEQLNSSDLDPRLIASLSGRIDQLRVESVSRAIRRLVENSLPDDTQAVAIIEDAYNLRSKIIHEGSTDADLQEKSQKAEEIIRRIFELKISEYTRLA